MNKTLFKYIFLKQLKAIIFVAISVFCLILLFEFAEASRKFSMTTILEVFRVIKLSFLRTPVTFCSILHYIYFLTATFSLWDLCRSHQITILKSTGKSPQQILFPFISFSIIVAIIWLAILHPLGIFAENLYKRDVENSNISTYEINTDIWINSLSNEKILFIKSLDKNKITNFYFFNIKTNQKLFAESGILDKDYLNLANVTILKNNQVKNFKTFRLIKTISPDLIKLLSLPPYRQDIYSLYKIYDIQKTDKVNVRLYELALHKLLANAITFILFAIIAAVICFPINRYKTKTNIAIKVIFVSLFLKFANNMMESLAYTGVVSAILSAWAITLVLLLTALSILVWKEA